MITITYAELARAHACPSGLRLFRVMYGEGGEITLEKCYKWVNETYHPYSGPAIVARCLGPVAYEKYRREAPTGTPITQIADALWRTVQHLHAMG